MTNLSSGNSSDSFRSSSLSIVRPLAILLLLLGDNPAQARPSEAERVFSQSKNVVAKVVAQRGKDSIQGSAVAITPWLLATAYHVVRHSSQIQVQLGEQSAPAILLSVDRQSDLALLAVTEDRMNRVVRVPSVARRLPPIGSRVYAIGNPLGLDLSLSDGLVSGLRRDGERGTMIQVTNPISPGSSGGGLFDQSGHLVGITVASATKGQLLNFAVPIEKAAVLRDDLCNDPEVAIRWPTSENNEDPLPFPEFFSAKERTECSRLFGNTLDRSLRIPLHEKYRSERCNYVLVSRKSAFYTLQTAPASSPLEQPSERYACQETENLDKQETLYECCPLSGASVRDELCLRPRVITELSDGFGALMSAEPLFLRGLRNRETRGRWEVSREGERLWCADSFSGSEVGSDWLPINQ